MTQYKKNSLVTSMASHTSGLLQIFLILPLQSPLQASSCSFSLESKYQSFSLCTFSLGYRIYSQDSKSL